MEHNLISENFLKIGVATLKNKTEYAFRIGVAVLTDESENAFKIGPAAFVDRMKYPCYIGAPLSKSSNPQFKLNRNATDVLLNLL